jgi:hypothetical protein
MNWHIFVAQVAPGTCRELFQACYSAVPEKYVASRWADR